MQDMKCQKCGAECAAGTNFCRQCGAPIASEQTTALLNPTDGITTERLESRATAPNRGPLPVDGPSVTALEKSAGGLKTKLIVLLVIVLIGVITAVAIVGFRSDDAASSDLIYPGAKTVLDMTSEGGGRALHLQTSDPFTAVEAWYQKNLKPEKTMRLTSSSVVLKNAKTTATIATDDNKTNILIKVSN
jgi:hypothetical protein